MDAASYLNEHAARVNNALRAVFTECGAAPPLLVEAMEYSLFAGGKRLRPALVLGACEIVGGTPESAMPAACAVEMIHTYSLIHDDLPAMDDDDLRRGKPTLHRAYDEATAILAGDTMLTMAFGVLAETGNLQVVREVAGAAGIDGMAAGQLIDLQSEGKHLGVDELKHMHGLKTGALIRVSVRAGAILGGAPDDQLRALTQYGDAIGLAFQIADDILDVTGTAGELGKPPGSDVLHDKSTYVGACGLEGARALANETMQTAIGALDPLGAAAEPFRLLARYIVERAN